MEVIEQVISKLQTLKDSLPDIAEKVIQDAAPQIEDQIIFQLRDGQKGDGSSLPNYSKRSVEQFGKPFGPIKLFDTGDFYQGVKASVKGTDLEIDDTDSKTPMLQEKYGSDILALQDQRLEELKQDVFLPGILYEVNRLLSA